MDITSWFCVVGFISLGKQCNAGTRFYSWHYAIVYAYHESQHNSAYVSMVLQPSILKHSLPGDTQWEIKILAGNSCVLYAGSNCLCIEPISQQGVLPGG